MKKRILAVLALMGLATLLLGACAPAATPVPATTAPTVAQATKAPATNVPATSAPTTAPATTAATSAPATSAPTSAAAATTAPTSGTTQTGPDLKGKTITFYAIGDASGPFAAVTGSVVNGDKDLIQYINENGGIFGANVDFKFEDSAGKTDQAVAAYNRFASSDKNIVMLLLYSSADQQTLRDRLIQDKVPTLGSAPDVQALYGVKDGWQFTTLPLYTEMLAAFMDYTTANWAKIKPAGAGDKPKLAQISWGNAVGQSAISPESQAYLAKLGVDLVANEKQEVSPKADTTTNILNAQAAGANVIWTNSITFAPAQLLNDLSKLGLRDKFVVGGQSLALDIATYAFLSDPKNGVNFYAPYPYAWYTDTDNPGIQLANKILTKYNRTDKDKGIGRLIGQSSVDVAVEAIRRAILKNGYDKLNGQAVYDQLTQLKDYKVMGGLTTIDFTGGLRAARKVQIRQDQGGPGKFVVLKDFADAPDMRPKQ